MRERRAGISRPLDGLHILIVDDNADAREMLNVLLNLLGANATPVASVDEAMNALERCDFDIVLSDVHMPHEDGFALMRRVHAAWRGQSGEPAAIALTADSDPGLRWALAEAGFRHRLLKPVESTELVAALRDLVRAA